MPDKQRLPWLDSARGIAILLVVLGHIVQGATPLRQWVYAFHIPLFFILTGILLRLRPDRLDQPFGCFVRHRARQLLYPYLTFSAVVMVYVLLRHGVSACGRVLIYTLTLEGHTTLWFLPACLLAECLFFAIRRSRFRDFPCFLLLALGSGLYAAAQFHVLGGGEPAAAGPLFGMLNFFCRAAIGSVFVYAGYALYPRLTRRIDALPRCAQVLSSTGVMVVCAFAAQLNGLVDLHYCVLNHAVLYYPLALAGSFSLILLLRSLDCRCAMLVFFGRNSLTVMATHYALPIVNFAIWCVSFLSAGQHVASDLLALLIVMALEAGVIGLINRLLPWMLAPPKSAGR